MTACRKICRAAAGLLFVMLICRHASTRAAAPVEVGDLVHCASGAVASVNREASVVGVDMMRRGGNAVDAAVATAFALAVTHPTAGNLGGGGYLVVTPSGGKPAAIDFRETAPLDATRDMFVDPAGRTPHRRVGVPGTVRGLALAHKQWGKLPWRELVAPSVKLAQNGFALDATTAASLNGVLRGSDKTQFAELHRVYGQASGAPWRAGDRLTLPQLADTLAAIASDGPDAFYLGKTAELIVAEMRRGGGLIRREDLASYRALAREPVVGTYRGCTIVGAPPSSSGGTVLVEMLNILENFDLRAHERGSGETLHLLIETMKRGYADRATYLADPDFATIPALLLDKEYARTLAAGINPQRATPSAALGPPVKIAAEGDHTTHFSVIDADRTAVSVTYTLESGYGSRVVVPDAGFLLNDEMNDFNWLPGTTDASGRIGTEPNVVAPGKRMLSSMCPTIVLRDGKPLLITGSPGGRTIINTVLCVTVNVIDYQMDLRAAVDAPRLHHQWLPDQARLESGSAGSQQEAIARLKAMGHAIGSPARQGDAHSIWIDPASGQITAAADGRSTGAAAGF